MDGFFIQQNVSGGFNDPVYRPDLENYSATELAADNWYSLVVQPPPFTDLDKKRTATYTLQDGVVYQNYVVEAKVGEELTFAQHQKWMEVRFNRDELLRNSDWTQLNDAPITLEKKTAWATYRQQLRDITMQSDPFNIVWPSNPNGLSGNIGVVRV